MEIGRITGLIVCANGISSSMMLASQLKELFPEIYFSEVFNGDQFTDISVQNYDLVFSTIPVESPKPTFVVKPLMTLVEKKHLLQSVYRHFPNLSSQSKHLMIDEIMSVIKKMQQSPMKKNCTEISFNYFTQQVIRKRCINRCYPNY